MKVTSYSRRLRAAGARRLRQEKKPRRPAEAAAHRLAAGAHREWQSHQPEDFRGLRRRPGSPAVRRDLSAEDKEQIRENLARVELFAQDAEKNGLIKEPDVAAAMEISRLQVIQQATAAKIAKGQEPTDAELRAEYEAQLAAMPQVEFRARHIVVSGEDVAQKILDRLKSGGDFATLAKQMSTHKESATHGGEMGWFPPNVLGPDFATAVGLLKKGEITPRPVQIAHGLAHRAARGHA